MSFLLYHKPFMRPMSDCLIYVVGVLVKSVVILLELLSNRLNF